MKNKCRELPDTGNPRRCFAVMRRSFYQPVILSPFMKGIHFIMPLLHKSGHCHHESDHDLPAYSKHLANSVCNFSTIF